MPDGGGCIRFVATRGGKQALEILKTGGSGHVTALFDRSFYIAFDQDWVCVGSNRLPLGPLNVRSSTPDATNWNSSGLRIDDKAVSSGGTVRIGQAFEFVIDDAEVWEPPPTPPWTVRSAKSGLDALHRLALPRTDAGLAQFVSADMASASGNGLMEAAGPPIRRLSEAMKRAMTGEAPLSGLEEAVIGLLGLGPGLTPSGDDFLGGMLIALHNLPAKAFRARLDETIEKNAPRRTNAISIAHLRAAGSGCGHALLHDILNSLLSGDGHALSAQLTAIGDIGHSSGWDALAGVCVALRAFVSAQMAAGPFTGNFSSPPLWGRGPA